GTVGCRDHDHVGVLVEAVHLDENLVERLLALVVAAADAEAALATDRVDFVDEDDTRRVALGLIEEVSDAARADADEQLDELRARDAEEGHPRLAGHRSRQQRLAGARRADQKHALWRARPNHGELRGRFQKLHDLAQLLLRLVDALGVFKVDLGAVGDDLSGPTLQKREGLIRPVLTARLPSEQEEAAN